jgi:hypothetical protein
VLHTDQIRNGVERIVESTKRIYMEVCTVVTVWGASCNVSKGRFRKIAVECIVTKVHFRKVAGKAAEVSCTVAKARLCKIGGKAVEAGGASDYYSIEIVARIPPEGP